MKEWCNRNDENMHAKKGAAGIMNVGAVIVAAQDLAQDKTGNEELETFSSYASDRRNYSDQERD